jgi:flavin reductase (DIM6/NTAB) family NADH-FMN oxidoreductase RutF
VSYVVFIENLDKYNFHYPANVAIVCSKHEERVNLMSAAWHTQLSHNPPLYGISISPKRFTHDLILVSKEFTVNFLRFEQSRLAAFFGKTSGRDIDKVNVFEIDLSESRNVKAPFLKDSYAVYECKLVDFRNTGDHTFFIGKIVGIHYDPNAFSPSLNIYPTLYLGTDLYITTDNSNKRLHDEKQVKEYLSRWVQGG